MIAMKKAILSSEIGLRLRPSKFLWGWGWLFSMLVVFSLVYSLPLRWAALAVLAYILVCVWQWTQLPATRWPWSVQSLRVDVFGQMTLTDKRGHTWSFAVLPDSVVHPACIVLHLTALVPEEDELSLVKTPSALMTRWFRPKRLLILPDQADTQALQALRVWLKWGLRE
jgi:hypothetical protein